MPESFIQNFLKYNEGNECPKPYVLWTAYGLLSAAVGHGLYCNMEYFLVRCDTYILLIGPSGGRKTSALVLGLDLLKEALPDIILSGDNETYQGILNYLHSDETDRYYMLNGDRVIYKPYHIMSEELMDYLQLNPVAMVTFLTNIYGKKGYRYRLKNEEHYLNNPYVTMCACSVPEWLTDQLKAKQFAEGYGRRTILVCHSGIIRKKPILSDESAKAREACIKRLRDVRKLVGPITFGSGAEEFYWRWYTTQKDPSDKFLQNWYSSRHLNVLKVAMLTSASESDDKIVTLDHIKLAISLVVDIEHNISMVTDMMGRNETNAAILTTLNVLRSAGGKMLEKELKLKTLREYKNAMEQFSTFQQLRAVGHIEVLPENVNGVVRNWIILKRQN